MGEFFSEKISMTTTVFGREILCSIYACQMLLKIEQHNRGTVKEFY